MAPSNKFKKRNVAKLQAANAANKERRLSQSAASQDSGGDSTPQLLPGADIDNRLAEDALRIHRDNFDRRLEERGLRRVIVPSDGNCMRASAAANLGMEGPNASSEVRE
jgi:hypothetical protein